MNLNHVTVPVTSIPRARAFYRLLGFKAIVLADHYCRFALPDGDATFSIERAPEAASPHATQLCFECEHLDAECERLVAAGVAFDMAPTDMRWLWRQAHLRDPDGNLIVLYYAGENRKNPPWRVTDEA